MSWERVIANRRLEWWLSTVTICFGLFLVVWADALEGERYATMLVWAHSEVWGGAAAMIGLFHGWALSINGRRTWTPYVRVAATVLNASLFTIGFGAVVAASIVRSLPFNLTVLLWLMMVGASVWAFSVAARDSCEAIRRRDDA